MKKLDIKFTVLLVISYALIFFSGTGRASADAPDGWSKIFSLFGSTLSENELKVIVSNLTKTNDDIKGTSEFLYIYKSADKEKKSLMLSSAKAKLRELSRRNPLIEDDVNKILGPEEAGVNGSQFFGVPEIPGESYNALLDYMEFAAWSIPGNDYKSTQESRQKLDRAMQATFALSPPETRLQYIDFNVVYSIIRRENLCAGPRKNQAIFWLYLKYQQTSAFSWLPSLPPDIEEIVNLEGGPLFSQAKTESKNMPPDISSILVWDCTSTDIFVEDLSE